MGRQLGTSPFPTHTPTRKEEALQRAEAVLSSRTGVTGPEAYVGGKGVLGFGFGFFHGYKELNYLTAVLLKWLFQKYSLSKTIVGINHKCSSFHF